MGRRNPLERAPLLVLALVIAAGAWGCGGGGEPARTEVELTVSEGTLTTGERVIRVRQGDDVLLHWRTDAAASAHLHGYDIEARLRPGETTTMWLVARVTGRFPITLHREGNEEERTLGYLEVRPR